MRRVYVSTIFDQPIDVVWASLGDFHRVDKWIRIVHASSVEGAGTEQLPTIGSIRRLTVGEDRHTTRERLVSYDSRARRMTYDLPDAPPFGMTEYLGTIHAVPVTDSHKTFVEWYGQYTCASADEAPTIEDKLRGIYTVFLGDLRDHLTEMASVTPVA
ncbi:SRPBCC family protein [Rhodococcus oxybenzonivorans]|nr:SRPBCC family protein [Rhodococcus oxybenzonivorans]